MTLSDSFLTSEASPLCGFGTSREQIALSGNLDAVTGEEEGGFVARLDRSANSR
jgi:hypothetical protein